MQKNKPTSELEFHGCAMWEDSFVNNQVCIVSPLAGHLFNLPAGWYPKGTTFDVRILYQANLPKDKQEKEFHPIAIPEGQPIQ
jgi:hypothetical protein